MTWDDAAIARLRELAAEGARSAQIAQELGTTRSAVIGICYRRGIALKIGTGGRRTWTPELEDQLRELARTCNVGQIVARLGLTDNQVRGHLRALGIKAVWQFRKPRKHRAGPRAGTHRQGRTGAWLSGSPKRTLKPVVPVHHPDEPPSLDISLFDLQSHHCRWAHGERAPYLFCGHETVPGSSYCEHHTMRTRVAMVENNDEGSSIPPSTPPRQEQRG